MASLENVANAAQVMQRLRHSQEKHKRQRDRVAIM